MLVANTYGNKFIIPLDIEMLDSTMSYYQSGLGNRLCYKITFNDYDQAIILGNQTPSIRLQMCP